jgi:small-conductance mechanosensitive channel
VAASILQFAAGKILNRIAARWAPMPKSVFVRTRAVAHFAFVILAVAIALPLAPLTPGATYLVQKILTAGFICLIGWIAIVASRIAADRYVSRVSAGGADTLEARKAITQVRILSRSADALIVVLTIGLALMTFDSVRQYGVSLFASAGVVGIIVGIAAQPTLGNLFAGVQLAITQPIRIGDSVVVEGEFGTVEEINSTYVVIKLWDWRRLVVPLTHFLQKPFQNWTRTSSSLLGSVVLYVDYSLPLDKIRSKLNEIVRASPLWDHQVVNLQVTDCKETSMEIRALVSAATASAAGDLRAEVREKLLVYIEHEFPQALPRRRGEIAVPHPIAVEAEHGDVPERRV